MVGGNINSSVSVLLLDQNSLQSNFIHWFQHIHMYIYKTLLVVRCLTLVYLPEFSASILYLSIKVYVSICLAMFATQLVRTRGFYDWSFKM